MTVYFDKARKQWRYDFWHQRQRYTGYCIDDEGKPAANKTEAKRLQEIVKGRVKSRAPEQAPAPITIPGEATFAQAVAIYAAKRQNTPNWKNDRKYAKELLQWFGPERPLVEITQELIWSYINGYSRKQHKRVWIWGSKKLTGNETEDQLYKTLDELRDDATTNRYLEALRAILNDAHEARDSVTKKRLLEDVPDVPVLVEDEAPPNPVPLPLLASIIRTGPQHLAKAILLTVAFGFRKMEALTLDRTKQIDWEHRGIRLTARGTKGKRPEFLPADDAAMAMLELFDAEAAAAGVNTLVYYVPPGKDKKARPIVSIAGSWETALRQHGVPGRYRFHDIKASFVSLMGALASGPITKGWARHRSFATTERYLALANEPKRQAGAALIEQLEMAGIILPRASSPTRESHTKKKALGGKPPKALI